MYVQNPSKSPIWKNFAQISGSNQKWSLSVMVASINDHQNCQVPFCVKNSTLTGSWVCSFGTMAMRQNKRTKKRRTLIYIKSKKFRLEQESARVIFHKSCQCYPLSVLRFIMGSRVFYIFFWFFIIFLLYFEMFYWKSNFGNVVLKFIYRLFNLQFLLNTKVLQNCRNLIYKKVKIDPLWKEPNLI